MTADLETRAQSALQAACGLIPISLADHKSGWSARMCLARTDAGPYLLKMLDGDTLTEAAREKTITTLGNLCRIARESHA